MPGLVSTLRRALWLVCVSTLLLAPRADAGENNRTDVDGDGLGDQVTLSRGDPTVLRVWLSATNTTNIIRHHDPMLGVAVVDLDGDHLAEVVASHATSGLTVWAKRARGFRALHPTLPAPRIDPSPASRRAANPDPTPSASTTDAFGSPEQSLPDRVDQHAPALISNDYARGISRGPLSSPCATPFAPRPPPASAT